MIIYEMRGLFFPVVADADRGNFDLFLLGAYDDFLGIDVDGGHFSALHADFGQVAARHVGFPETRGEQQAHDGERHDKKDGDCAASVAFLHHNPIVIGIIANFDHYSLLRLWWLFERAHQRFVPIKMRAQMPAPVFAAMDLDVGCPPPQEADRRV
ncbi:MAG: hypothetical protein QHC40_13395 [Sphingobium sp.]|nr:hypothetical protein [Sphingobium sp.]